MKTYSLLAGILLSFSLSIQAGDLKLWYDWLVGQFGDFVANFMKDGWFKDLLVDGVIAGVGS